MSNSAITIDPRARALSFMAAAGIVTLACIALLLFSRVVQYADTRDTSVHVFMTEEPRPAPPPRATPPAARINAPNPLAAPAPTPLPVDSALLQRAMNCFNRLNRDRPADCPREALEEDPGDRERTRSAYDPTPRPAPPVEYPMGIDPPCDRGIHLTGAGIAGCVAFGITPPPPTRSAEEVCVAGRVGPCHPPEFREEDVVRLRHTD
ncbi:MAG: hypothetical protein NT015_11175 [Alphaproteobacteria bacterium]|nr:hypothetical protein [Alphaproteobacteria bacterium]